MKDMKLQFGGVVTKSESIPGMPANFADGYSVTGWFGDMPEEGQPFWLYPTQGEFAGGYFHTSAVQSVSKVDENTVSFTTKNSLYLLKFKPLEVKVL